MPPRHCPRTQQGHLHSWSVRSSAWVKPFSENVSTDCVPFIDDPLTTTVGLARMASTKWASSAAFLIQAPSWSVESANEIAPISAVASPFGLNG